MANVLLIEPDVVLARSYIQALQHVGHVVGHARSAQEALDAADTFAPDVVVLELQLAAHSGIEFLHEFRSYAEWQGVPVVINTLITPGELAHAKTALEQDLGVSICLYKPRTSLQQLISVINERAAST